MPAGNKDSAVTSEFERLAGEVAACRLCPRMGDRTRVLSAANGPLHAQIVFIGEAPGRLGADATQIPFHGDKAGDNFETLLSQVGLNRYDCFITNAVLCNPRNEEGNNAPPNKHELRNCSGFLQRQISLVDPSIVVTLGAQSLSAVDNIEPHGLSLSTNVRTAHQWSGRILIPLYHPGQRAMIHRSFLNQLADYQFVAETLRRNDRAAKQPRRSSAKKVDGVVQDCVRAILRRGHEVSYFKLHKLFYLLEYMHYRRSGCRISRAYIVRQKDGPYVTDLHVGSLKRTMDDIEVVRRGSKLLFRLAERDDLFAAHREDISVAGEIDGLVEELWEKYGALSSEKLKTVVYLTSPMRSLLRHEKSGWRATFNYPVDFGR